MRISVLQLCLHLTKEQSIMLLFLSLVGMKRSGPLKSLVQHKGIGQHKEVKASNKRLAHLAHPVEPIYERRETPNSGVSKPVYEVSYAFTQGQTRRKLDDDRQFSKRVS